VSEKIEDLDLSEFGLAPEANGLVPEAAEPTDAMTTAIRRELGLDAAPVLPTANVGDPISAVAPPAPTFEGLDLEAEPSPPAQAQADREAVEQQAQMLRRSAGGPNALAAPNYAPFVGQGLFEQLLVEVRTLNANVAYLCTLLSSPEFPAPSADESGSGQSSASAKIASGNTTPTRRGRGRPKKEEETVQE